jgi:integrase/recombinase XerC
MASLLKRWIVRYLDADGKRVPKNTPGARKVRKRAPKWYGQYRDANGHKQRVPLCRDKAAALQMLADLVKAAERAKAGLSDPRFEEHAGRPLADHLEDFRRELLARDDEPRYVADVVSRLKALLKGCGFTLMADLSASRVSDWLADLRRKVQGRVPLEPGKEWFTVKEAGAVLGMKPHSVSVAARRCRLKGEGNGRRRRYPRATVEALQDRQGGGVSVRTSNAYLKDMKAFCRWLVKDTRMPASPLAHLETGNAEVDRRHDRRELEAEELRQLLRVTRASERTFRGLTGPDRFTLYLTACATGFRASALASLTPESFDLDGETPTVTLAARNNKSRKLKVQPLKPSVADLLRDYLDGKPAGRPVWGGTGTWARDHKGAEMLRLDLEAAGIPYAVEGPDGPLFVDFHALRHTYLTLGGRAGIDLRTLQGLAGHSTPNLTARYSHRRLYDLAGAVEKLPDFLPAEGPGEGALCPTGTDGRDCPPG